MKEMVRMKVCGKYQWILYILSNASKRKYAYVWYTGRNRWNKNRLEELRKERGIKQEELASAMEVSRLDYWLLGEWKIQSVHFVSL